MTTDAVEEALGDPTFRFFEVNLDPLTYSMGHLPGSIALDWEKQLRNTETFEIISPEELTLLLGRLGVMPKDRMVLYGDNKNWFACWMFWLLDMAGHQNVWIMDGGTQKWLAECKPMTKDIPSFEHTDYRPLQFDETRRADVDNVFGALFSPETHCLLDVRSSPEFEGQLLGPAGAAPRCAMAGRIPGAINIPWNLNCNKNGTFKCHDELEDLYASFNVLEESVVITYCAIGERASLTWFVLKHLLDRKFIMNYDRGMAQWSRIANAPMVERGAA